MNDSTIVDTLAQVHSQANQISGWTIFLITLGVIVFTSLVGLYLIRKRRREIIEEIQFSSTYLEKLIEYLESHGEDINTYSWLVEKSTKMQRIMGPFGKASYITPGQQYKINNQDIVINFVPQIKKEFENELNRITPHFETISFYADTLQEALLRFLGDRRDELEEVENKLNKPHDWFTLGIRQIVSLPIYALVIFGIMTIQSARKWRDSIFIKLLSFLFFLVGIVGSIMTIVLGWEKFWSLVSKYF